MTEEQLGAAVERLMIEWRASKEAERRIRRFKRIGKVRRAQIQEAMAESDRIIRKMDKVARKAGMSVHMAYTQPLLVERRKAR